MRAKPPGITRQPSGVAAAKTRRVNGRGVSLPPRQTGVVESRTTSCPTTSTPRARMRATSASRAGPRRSAPSTEGFVVNASAKASSSMRSSASSRAAASPHHQVAMLGKARSSPSRRRHCASMKPISARCSTAPAPGMFDIATPPARRASTSPGTPSRERADKVRGSQ